MLLSSELVRVNALKAINQCTMRRLDERHDKEQDIRKEEMAERML